MKDSHKLIIKLIEESLTKDPSQRFGQCIFNIGINEFQDKSNPGSNYSLRDIFYDTDADILNRIK